MLARRNEYVNVYSFAATLNVFACQSFSIYDLWKQKSLECLELTPNAEKRFRLGCGSCLLRKTSDLGRGGFFGRIITRDSSRMSSSSNLLSDETDNCLCTGPCSPDQSRERKGTNNMNQTMRKSKNIFLPHNETQSRSCNSPNMWFS